MNFLVTSQNSSTYTIQVTDNVWGEIFNGVQNNLYVIDSNVYRIYKNFIPEDIKFMVVEVNEESKNISTADAILQFFNSNGILRRKSTIYAIGGGVLLDLVGFCASIFRRGVAYVRVPTTLLAIVDASVGIKTGINYSGYRNRLGTYYSPTKTIVDPSFIKTQENRQISNGIGEILKLAIIADLELFELMENTPVELLLDQKFQNDTGKNIIIRAITGMIKELGDNLYEKILSRSMDFGHTFSPVVEMKNVTVMLHGESVIIDCLFSACIAVHRGILHTNDMSRIHQVIKKFNLSRIHPDFFDAELIYGGLLDVSHHRDDNQHLPLPAGIGNVVFINDLTLDEIKETLKILRILC